MLKFNAEAFYRVTAAMHHSRASVEALRGRKGHDGSTTKSFIDQQVANSLVEQAKDLQSGLLVLGTQITSMAVDDLLKRLVTWQTLNYDEISRRYAEIASRLANELSLVTTFVLEKDKTKFYEPKEPLFGTNFQTKFPSAQFELDEAGKCIAFGRDTAAVFHFMRVMEIGVRAVARSLQIPDPLKPADKNWGTLLGLIWKAIEQKWPTNAARMSGDGQIFEALYTSLDAVKNPWRNATMHVENKYTFEEAEHIYVAVRGFMKKLSDRMDENGLPLA